MIKEYIAYFQDNPQGYWFKARLYGWGWVPVRRQGWMAVLVYIAAVFVFALTLDEESPNKEVFFTFVLPLVLLTATLIKICYKKGERPKWQWGLPKEDKK